MVPVSGSAYTYSYAVMGELLAWMVGWALVLEYAVGGSAVAVGWSNYAGRACCAAGWAWISPTRLPYGDALIAHMSLTCLTRRRRPISSRRPRSAAGSTCPPRSSRCLVTWLLVIGTKESATGQRRPRHDQGRRRSPSSSCSRMPVHQDADHFEPVRAARLRRVCSAAAASIFFAYVGFDSVSTAAEETKQPAAQHADRPDRLVSPICTRLLSSWSPPA